MIYVTGDYHGGMESRKLGHHFFPEGAALTKDDYVIIAGDFGLWWTHSRRGTEALAELDAMPWTTLFVDGNHEGFANLYQLDVERWHGGETSLIPGTGVRWLRRGQVFELEGQTILTMGGATSVDRAWRTPGVSWFEEELPSDAEKNICLASLDACNWQVDYVITHTCPTIMQAKALWPEPGWTTPVADHLTDFLTQVDERLSFKRWYFGHFHHDRDIDDTHSVLYECTVPLGEPVDPYVELFKQRQDELCK